MRKARLAQGTAAPSTVPVLLQSLQLLPWHSPATFSCRCLFSIQVPVLSELTCHRDSAPQTKGN